MSLIPKQLFDAEFAFFVPSPESFRQSNGITVMLDAMLAASQAGLRIVLIPSHSRRITYSALPNPYRDIPVRWQVPDGCCAIVTDTITPDLLEEVRAKARSVCHYTLAPWGLFRDCGVFSNFQIIKRCERQAVYSPHVSTKLPFYYLQNEFKELEKWIPWAHERRAHRYQRGLNRNLRACIYPGKGYPVRLENKELRHRISRSASEFITRYDPIRGSHHPATKSALYKTLASSDLLISFDPISSLAHEATLLGIPCLIKAPWDEQEFSELFPVRLDGISWNNENEMLRLVEQGFDHPSVISSYKQAISNNVDQLIGLLCFAIDPNEPTLHAEAVNAYWGSRQKFFESLALPSAHDKWGGVGTVLKPVHKEDILADILEWLKTLSSFLRYVARKSSTLGWIKYRFRRMVSPLQINCKSGRLSD